MASRSWPKTWSETEARGTGAKAMGSSVARHTSTRQLVGPDPIGHPPVAARARLVSFPPEAREVEGSRCERSGRDVGVPGRGPSATPADGALDLLQQGRLPART